jgi:uncharacterized repeat protein (TIGR01451 family)
MSYNQLTSPTIPTPVAQSLDLSHNQITGSVSVGGYTARTNYSYNNITSASISDIFRSPWGGIIRVILSHNMLTSLPTLVLNKTLDNPVCDVIDVSYNNITSLNPNSVQNITSNFIFSSASFGSLILDGNNLIGLPSDALLKLRKYIPDINDYLVFSQISMNNCNLNTAPELYEKLTGINLNNNNIYCLPKLPSTLGELYIDTNKITCIPNAGSLTINGKSSATYLVCNSTNNVNGCKGYPTFSGVIYLDKNKNGVKDNGEPYKSNVKVQLSNGNYTFTDNNGYFQIQADSIGSYTLTVTPPTGYNAVPASVTYNFSTYDTTITPNIALQPALILDSVAINVIPVVMNAVQGGAMPYWVEYTNAGTTTLSPTVALTYNNYLLAYDSCTDANAIPIANGVVTGTPNMQSGTTKNFISYFTIKPSANVGDTLTTVYSITTPSINQTDSFYMIIEGGVAASNAQRATQSITTAQVASGKDIVYSIGFKNTGNDTAYNVVITDTLSNLLRANTVQMISSSHTCKTTVKGNIVTFELLNIKLPKATTNNLKSMGFVSFKVKPSPTLVAGNIITNKANTYYNYRAAQTSIATTVVKNIITPVRITNYEVRMTSERQITNYWTTSTEINTSHFNIQRSENGREFKTVGKVAAEGTGSYSFTDPLTTNNLPLTIYYRLEIVDKDGSKTYSDIKQIRLNQLTNQLINVYPNPAKGFVTISSKEIIKEIKLLNQLGQTVKLLNSPTAHQTINTKQFAKGLYVVQITTAKGETKFEKLILD